MSYPDVEIQREGTLFLVHISTDKGAHWIKEHVDVENATWFGQALVVEHRYIGELAKGMTDDGLVVK